MGLGVLVAWPDDKLAGAVADAWRARGRPWRWLVPETLASVDATIADGRLSLGAEPVTAIVWRAAAEVELGADFAPEDRAFADAEARAFWLAALNLPTLAATLRPDAALFFARSGWRHWRELLRRHGVPLAPVRLGGEPLGDWLPYAAAAAAAAPGPKASRMLAAASFRGPLAAVPFAGMPPVAATTATVAAALPVLGAAGVALGAVLAAPEGVVGVDIVPRFDDPATIRALLPPLLAALDDPADRR